MYVYILNRLGMMALTLFAIITLTFFLMHAVPGGPFVSERMLAPRSRRRSMPNTGSTCRSGSNTSIILDAS